MLIETGLAEELNLISACNGRFTGTPCQWHESSKAFSVDRKCFLYAAILGGLHSGGLFLSLAKLLITARTSGGPVDMGGFSLLAFLAPGILLYAYFCLQMYLEADSLAIFLNDLAKFEERHISTDLEWREELLRRPMARLPVLSCKLVRLTSLKWMPRLMSLGMVLMPQCEVNMAGYYPQRWVVEGVELIPYLGWILGKMLTFYWNLLLCSVATKYFCIWNTQLASGCVGLSTAILTLERENEERRMSNSFDWIVTTHLRLNMIGNIFNKLESGCLFAALVVMTSVHIIPGLILFSDNSAIAGRLGYFVTAVLAMIFVNGMVETVLFFGFCGDVHHTSEQCLERINRSIGMGAVSARGYGKVKRLRRMARALHLVKVNFGAMNFIEKRTPVVFQLFATEKLIECLLLVESL